MTTITIFQSSQAVLRAAASAIAVLLLTSVHHAYGAVIYGTPWRMHVLHISIPAAVLIGTLFYVGWTFRGQVWGRRANWAVALIVAAFPILAIGLFEGGYNHVLKNAMFFTTDWETVQRFFPGPSYEMPNDVFFELTGVGQFFLAVIAAVRLGQYLRGRMS